MQNDVNSPESDEKLSPQITGYASAARISNIGVEMVLPALIGIGLDRLFGTVVLFVVLGAVLGVTLGFWQLLKFARDM